jgi:unsaturated chondroitin disaccharide hydrolase
VHALSCRSIIAAAAAVVLLTAGRARGGPAGADPATDYALDFARDQFWTYSEAHTPAPPTPPSVYPSNTNRTTGVWNTAGSGGWESGFFPGGQFILYETRLSKPNPGPHDDPAQWWSWAKTWATPVVAKSDAATLLNGEHDLTYRLLCSRGHWWRLTADPVERDLQRTELLKGATNVLRTYAVKIAGGVAVPVNVKAFRTEDRVSGLDARGDFHVFADHVPDTALVLWAARQLNDVESARKCVNHFLTASRGTIRPDGSMNQRAFYNSVTGDFINGQTKQGLNNNSTWSRGQAWVLYGYTAGAQETGHPDVVATARKIADYFIAHLPKPPTGDYIPPWDFDPSIDPTLPENKDSSAGAIAASALLHLSRLIPDGDPCRQIYWDTATQILAKLAEPPVESNPAPYLAVNSNPFHQSVLVHGAYNFPGGNYDQGQIWGDYFFLEGLLRHRKLTADPPPVAVTVRASPDRIAEGGPACGVFTFTRTGDTSQDLVVFVRNLGTASAGTDFDYSTPFTGTVTIPAGATQAAIEVTPIPNDIAGENKFVTLVVDGTAGYVAELPYAATVVITDDDRPTVDLALVGGTLALTEGSTDTARLQLKRTDGNSNVNVTVTLAAQGTAVPVAGLLA